MINRYIFSVIHFWSSTYAVAKSAGCGFNCVSERLNSSTVGCSWFPFQIFLSSAGVMWDCGGVLPWVQKSKKRNAATHVWNAATQLCTLQSTSSPGQNGSRMCGFTSGLRRAVCPNSGAASFNRLLPMRPTNASRFSSHKETLLVPFSPA